VIGASFTIESAVKSVYENTIGRASAWMSSSETEEDRVASGVAAEYGASMHEGPWYRFPFAGRLARLWV
jgi:hypothetical protein